MGAGARALARLPTDAGAVFDREVVVDAAALAPQVTWGTNPGQIGADHRRSCPTPRRRATTQRALAYMGLTRRRAARRTSPVDRVFIGSCTNSRLEDLRAAAAVVRGKQRRGRACARMVVPGSMRGQGAAEAEGLDRVFTDAGFEWRDAGCSMCLGMNADVAGPGERVRLDLQPQLRGPPGHGRRAPT